MIIHFKEVAAKYNIDISLVKNFFASLAKSSWLSSEIKMEEGSCEFQTVDNKNYG